MLKRCAFVLCSVALCAIGTRVGSVPVQAYDGLSSGNTTVTGGRAGHLSAHDVIDRRALDFMGNSLGMIQGVSADGRLVIIMPSGGNQPFTVEMSRLSLGMGIHTIIVDAHKEGDTDP